MLKKAISFMMYRKKSTALMLLFIVISAFLLQSIGPLFDTVMDITFEEGVDTYGRHHAIFFDMTEEQLRQLREYSLMDTVGIMKNYGVYTLAEYGQVLTFGSFDEVAQSLGSIEMVEGSFPKTMEEVAIESHLRYLQKGEPLQLGDIISVQTSQGSMSLTISGFVESYTGQWNSFDVLEPGVNDYPHCLLAEGSVLDAEGSTNALLYLKPSQKMVMPMQMILQLSNAIGDIDGQRMVFNDATYGTQQEARIYTLRQLKNLFMLLGIAGIGLLLYIALTSYLKPFIQSAQTMYMLGASHGEVLCPLLLWNGLLSIGGILLGVASSGFFAMGLKTQMEFQWQPATQWMEMVLLFVAAEGISVWFFARHIRKYRGMSWSDRDMQKKVEEIEIGKSIVFPLAKFHIRCNWKRMLGTCVLVAMYLTLLFCVQHQAANTQKEIEQPTVSVSAMEGFGLNFYGEFELSSKMQGYDIREVNAIGVMPGVVEIRKSYYVKPASLIYPENGDEAYYNQLMQRYSVGSWMTGETVAAVPENIRATRDGYSIIVLDQWNMQDFKDRYPDAVELEAGEVIMFCPIFEGGSSVIDSITNQAPEGDVVNTAYKEGDMLRFGMLETDMEFLMAIENLSEIAYVEEQAAIAQVYNMGMLRMDEPEKRYETICVVMTEETAEMLSFVQKISRFHVVMEKGLERSQYEMIEAQINRTALTLQGARVLSYLQERDFFERMGQAVQLGYVAISVVLIVFIAFSIGNITYETLLQRQRQFGIMRATGYPQKELYITIWLELFVYWGIAGVLTMILSLWGIYQYSLNICGPIIQGDAFLSLMGKVGWYMLGMQLIFTAIAFIMTRSIFKKSISSCIRFAE